MIQGGGRGGGGGLPYKSDRGDCRTCTFQGLKFVV